MTMLQLELAGLPMMSKHLTVKDAAGEELQVGVLEEDELLQLDVQQLEYRSVPVWAFLTLPSSFRHADIVCQGCCMCPS